MNFSLFLISGILLGIYYYMQTYYEYLEDISK